MSYINVKHLWKNYGDHVVLEDINKDVQEGDFITIVGASGCGKSTFLKLLLGTETATKGSIELDSKPLIDEPSEDRGIVFQKYSVFPHLTAIENMILCREFDVSPLLGRLFGAKVSAVKEEAMQMLEAVGLKSAYKKYPHEMSGGMQQRLALAQSLMKKPRVLLLDEPFGALDPGIRGDVHDLVLDLWEKHRLTIFMVTHDIKEAFYLGTRLWVFDKDRHDPQAPEVFGAKVTYDLAVGKIPRESHEVESQKIIDKHFKRIENEV